MTPNEASHRREFPAVLRAAAIFLLLCLPLFPGSYASTDEADDAAEAASSTESGGGTAGTTQADPKKGSPITAWYKDGTHIESEDGNFKMRLLWRAQLRMTDLESKELFGLEDGLEQESGFRIRRARFKTDGHAYRPWLKFKFEYGIAASVMLTLYLETEQSEELIMRTGQYKVIYNRERVDSSGKQQFVDRSIVNSPFTIDRQQGIDLHGRLFKGTRADSNYVVGWYTGTGRGGGLDDETRGMVVVRWQWNFLKRVLPFSQSDIKRYEKPHASFAMATANNIGRFTRFSSAGGGQLPGFAPGLPGQYRLAQWMAELAYMHRGLSFQSEYHFKKIDDRVNLEITELDGWYAQVGYFFHEAFPGFPKPLELAVRAAAVDPLEGDTEIRTEREYTVCANWFFNGHNNKLTFDASRLESKIDGDPWDDGWRARLQWDITF